MLNPCRLCSAICCKNYTITVTSFDVLRIIKNTNLKPDEFAQLIPLKILNFDNDTVLECYQDGNCYEHILTLKSHSCYFLNDDNSCRIHEFSPLGCRLYPYQSNNKLTKNAFCPTIPKTLFRFQNPKDKAGEYLNQLDAYKKIVKEWNSKRGKKEDCLKFLLDDLNEEHIRSNI